MDKLVYTIEINSFDDSVSIEKALTDKEVEMIESIADEINELNDCEDCPTLSISRLY